VHRLLAADQLDSIVLPSTRSRRSSSPPRASGWEHPPCGADFPDRPRAVAVAGVVQSAATERRQNLGDADLSAVRLRAVAARLPRML